MAHKPKEEEYGISYGGIVLGVLAGMFALGVAGQLIGKHVTHGSAPPAPAAAPAPEAKAPAAVAAAPVASGLSLPGGSTLNASATGVESKLLGFINDSSAVIDKAAWFDFDRLNFETGSAQLTSDSKNQVENIAAILKAFPAVKIKIGGYTDNTGDPAANLKLSDDRAKAVVQALSDLGVAAERLEAEGYGDQHAIADNATTEGRAKNRRIAVSVRAK